MTRSPAIVPAPARSQAAAPVRALPPARPPLARRLAARLGGDLLPRAAWAVGRTGRAGLAGLALLLAAAVFLLSTHLQVSSDVEGLRAELAAARERSEAAPAAESARPAAAPLALPGRAEVPALLRQLFAEATRARLAVDTAKYEIAAAKGSGLVRYRIAFPVTGPYTQIRAFLDASLAAMPALALSDLALERKAATDGSIEAQVRMTLFTRSDQ